MVGVLASIACSPARRPKTAGLHWIASPPTDEAAATKSAALATAKRGIEQLGVMVTESAQADYRLQVVSVPGGKPPNGAGGEAFYRERRAEIFYFRTRTNVLLHLRADPSLGGGLPLAEVLGNTIGFIAVHEFGHLVVPDHDYHAPYDPSLYNSTGFESAAPAALTVNSFQGLGTWSQEMKARIIRNLNAN